MTYQPLGSSPLYISSIGFGCMSLSGDSAANIQLVQIAIEQGINYFDTADLYDKGANEVLVGKALKQFRQKTVLATKVGNQWRADSSGWDWNPRKAYILEAAEASLKRLQTDYIDLYQLHGGTIDDPIDETIDAFETLVKEGKIRYYGISSIRPNVIRRWVQRSRLVSVMMQYSLLDRRPEESCLPLLQQKHISVLAGGALAQGLLINKPPKPYLEYTAQQVQTAAAAVQQLSGSTRSAAQTALRFVLQQESVSSAVVGIRTPAQLEEAVQTINTPSLRREELHQLKNLLPYKGYTQHL